MRSTEFDQRMEYVSTLYAQEAEDRDGVAYVDARPVFAAEGGGYSAYLPGSDGQLVNMRLGDGIHLTRPGAERLSAQVIAALESQWDVGRGRGRGAGDGPRGRSDKRADTDGMIFDTRTDTLRTLVLKSFTRRRARGSGAPR